MDIFRFSMNTTLPVVLCMAIGIWLRWKKRVDQATSGHLSALCFRLFLPVLTFNNLRSIDFGADFSPRLITAALLGIMVMFTALLLILSLLFQDKIWLAACTHVGFRSNYIMMGIPLAQNMFGESGVRVASMLIPIVVIPFNFIALFLFSLPEREGGVSAWALLKSTLDKAVKNPLIIATALGALASLCGVSFPLFLETTLLNVGGIASALCLIVLGTQISFEQKIQHPRRVFGMTLTRLILVPLVMLSVYVALGFRGAELAALLALFATPCANSAAIMARQYHIKPVFTAQVTATTTLLSGLTIFAGVFLLRTLGLL